MDNEVSHVHHARAIEAQGEEAGPHEALLGPLRLVPEHKEAVAIHERERERRSELDGVK